MAAWRDTDKDGEGTDTDAAIAASAKKHGMLPLDDELNMLGGPSAEEILRLGKDDKKTGPEHLRAGLHTRLEALGEKTHGLVPVLRERLAKRLRRELPPGRGAWA